MQNNKRNLLQAVILLALFILFFLVLSSCKTAPKINENKVTKITEKIKDNSFDVEGVAKIDTIQINDSIRYEVVKLDTIFRNDTLKVAYFKDRKIIQVVYKPKIDTLRDTVTHTEQLILAPKDNDTKWYVIGLGLIILLFLTLLFLSRK